MSALVALLAEAIDDAGLFPPAQLDMEAALAAHEGHASSAYAWMLGRFVVAASRLNELLDALDEPAAPLELAVVLDGDPVADVAAVARAERAAAGRCAVAAFECRGASLRGDTADDALAGLAAALRSAGYAETPAYVELSTGSDDAIAAGLAALHRARERAQPFYAKLRCGGATPEAVPLPARVAAFIWEAHRLKVPFKATAGLHHPVRATGPGGTMHGFLNVLGAAVLADARGLDRATLIEAVGDERPASFELSATHFTWNGIGADKAEIGAAREGFVHSFGSCSLDEPVADLTALGLLAAAR